MQTCKGCGAQSQDWETACPYCGNPLSIAKQQTQAGPGTPPPRPHKNDPRPDWRPSGAQPEPIQMFRAQKDRILAVLLAFFLGGIGVHWFYLGKTGRGAVYLIFFWTLIPMVLSVVDAVRFIAMNESDFHFRYG